ncbi:hypothetical protein [Dictyoglomus turgidum]|uniref:hypothetical protein n=1 Tax=Dictyoglomus turgidum TaxID=513050 RepID=UPI002356C6E0|nr:hypothetical protein [Dictyoglomus turgidum]
MKYKLFILIFLIFIITTVFSQTSLVVYQQNIGVFSFDKEVELKKGLNFVSLEEVGGSVSYNNLFVLSTFGNTIREIVYPSLGVWIEAKEDTKDILKIYIIVPNIKWSSNHMFLIDGNKIRFFTEVIIQNSSDMNFQKVKMALLLGSLSMERDSYGVSKMSPLLAEATPSLPEVESIEGYKLFEIPGEWSISRGAIKLIPLIDTVVEDPIKRYVLGYMRNMKNVYILWNIENKKEKGLGIPIPSGKVNIFTMENGRVVFLGSANISDVSEGEKIEVVQGQDFDLTSERRILEEKKRIEGKYEITERSVSIIIKNAKKEKVLVEVWEYISGDEIEIKSSNFRYEKIDKNNFRFYVEVEPGKSAVLNYTCSIRNLR